jgi:hypothetical protein
MISRRMVKCHRSGFTHVASPDLVKPAPYLIRGNPVFSIRIPAAVYTDENRDGNDGSQGINLSEQTLSKPLNLCNFYAFPSNP